MALVTSFQRSAVKRCTALACAIIACGLASVVCAAPAERQLAPGVLTTIPPSLNPEDTVSTHDIMEIRSNATVEWKPEYIASSDTLYGMSDKTKFRRDI